RRRARWAAPPGWRHRRGRNNPRRSPVLRAGAPADSSHPGPARARSVARTWERPACLPAILLVFVSWRRRAAEPRIRSVLQEHSAAAVATPAHREFNRGRIDLVAHAIAAGAARDAQHHRAGVIGVAGIPLAVRQCFGPA